MTIKRIPLPQSKIYEKTAAGNTTMQGGEVAGRLDEEGLRRLDVLRAIAEAGRKKVVLHNLQ